MISHRYRCIFVHIPKTGGSSIENVIWRGPRTPGDLWMGFTSRYQNKYQTGGLQHLLARQIRQEVGSDIFHSYWKFAIVRNPWDRAVSQYSSLARRPDLREFIGMNADASFAEYLRLIKKRLHVQWDKQLNFLLDESGKLLVDFIGRFEHLETDARAVFSRLGIAWDILPHEQRSEHRPYREFYNDETDALLRELYADDIEALGYRFGT